MAAKAQFTLGVRDESKPGFNSFQKNLQRAKRSFGEFSKESGLASGGLGRFIGNLSAGKVGLAALAAGAVLAASKFSTMVREQNAATQQLRNLSIRFNDSTQALQRLKFAGEQTGVTFQSMVTSVQRLQRRTAEAVNGNKGLQDAFKRLGIDVAAFSKLNIEGKMGTIADAMLAVEDPGERLRLQVQLMDVESSALLQTMADGSRGLGKFGDRLQELGGILSDDLIAKADKGAEATSQLKTAWDSLKQTVSAQVGDLFAPFKKSTATAIGTVTNLISGTRAAGKGFNSALQEYRKDRKEVTLSDTSPFELDKKKVEETLTEFKRLVKLREDERLKASQGEVRAFSSRDSVLGPLRPSTDDAFTRRAKAQIENVEGALRRQKVGTTLVDIKNILKQAFDSDRGITFVG